MKTFDITPRKPISKIVVLQTRVDEDFAKEVKAVCDKHGFMLTDVLRAALKTFMVEYGGGTKKKK